MYILEGEAQVLLWVPRAGGEEAGDPPPAAWSEDSLAPEALHTAGSQACGLFLWKSIDRHRTWVPLSELIRALAA